MRIQPTHLHRSNRRVSRASADEFADILTKAMTKGANDYVKFRNYIMNKFT